MKNIKVVVGANYGDEGKGHIVDYLSAVSGEILVVRFNGGAQAAHTVEIGSKRHVFSHFSSASFNSKPTFLSKFFVVNPMLFRKEILSLNYSVVVYVDPECLVTTPYDMLLNQWSESKRKHKHGSCGVGFNETIERSKYPEYCITVRDLMNRDYYVKVLVRIVTEYVFKRLSLLEISLTDDEIKTLNSHDMFLNYVDDILLFNKSVDVITGEVVFDLYDDVIFEGAQGLLLDQDSKCFPYVTRSKTGLDNVVELINSKVESEVIYVTRSYLTRHGEGPLYNEYKSVSFNVYDKTNKPNPWQGSLRYAPLGWPELATRIALESKKIPGTFVSLAVTCLDQLDSIPELHIAFKNLYLSYGPTRSDIRNVSFVYN